MARGLRRTDGFFDGGGVTPSPTPSLQLYKRTYGAVDYLVDVDGKLVTDDTVYVEVGASSNPNACVLALCSTNPNLSDIIAAWGKTTAVFSSQEISTTDYTITIGDDYVDIVEETATPAIEDFPAVTILCTPALPTTVSTEQSLQIRKSDGSTWDENEIANIKINGVSSTAGSSILWNIGQDQIFYNRGSATDVATLQTSNETGVVVTTVEFAE